VSDLEFPNFPASLGGLIDRYSLDSKTAAQLSTYASMLAYDELAPTTVRAPTAVRDDHLADALVGLELEEVRSAGLVADIGAGAGLPGLPLAVVLTRSRFVLVDGNARKCEFMQRAVAALELANVEVVHGRAETWTDGIGRCDLVVARALASLDVVEEYAAPLLKVGGNLVAWRGKRDPEVEADGRRAAELLGLEVHEPRRVLPYDGAENRYLHLISKVSATPQRFPRRDGVARKRPLGRV
jgi:16S rRNA (guanine527-N7)-methyltransferase